MLKLVLLAAVVWLIIRILKQYASNIEAAPKQAATQDMVRCHQCHTHIPKSESIQKDGRYYCCEAHQSVDK